MPNTEEMSVAELVAELTNRMPTLVLAMHVPDDAGTVDSVLCMSGNKAACVGLAWALHRDSRRMFSKGRRDA